MRKIPLTYGLLYFLDEIEHTDAALSADPDAADLATAFTDALSEWEDLFKKERAARREVIRAEAVVGVRNEQLDTLTMRFAKLARAIAAHLLPNFFGAAAPGAFVRRGLRLQSEKTRDVMLPAFSKVEPASPLLAFAEPLKLAAGSSLVALDTRSAKKGARQGVANDVDEWKEGVNVLRITTFAELLKIAAAKGHPRSWVESFFRRESGDEEPEVAGAPEGEPGKTPPDA